MLGIDALYDLRSHLTSNNELAVSDTEALRPLLKSIYELQQYQAWLADGQYYGPYMPQSRFHLPKEFGDGLPVRSKWLLERLGLINGDMLMVKIDLHHGRLHITDGNWVPADRRVYPFSDESEQIIQHIMGRGLHVDADLLIDPACGCGHHSLGLESLLSQDGRGIAAKINLDINPRALEFARLNAALADQSDVLCLENDVTRGIPPIFSRLESKHALIVANMPFAIFPKVGKNKDGSKMSQDGGERGVALTGAAIKAVADFMKTSVAKKCTAVILCYTLRDSKSGRIDIEEVAVEHVPRDRFTYTELTDELMWRVDGRKEQRNPMPVEKLRLKAFCRHTYKKDEMDAAAAGYDELAALYREKWTDLSYGILEITAG